MANGITGPTIQAFNFADAAHNAFNLNPWIGGALMAACVAVVAFGGAKRLGRVSELVIVPVMAIIYIILALVILGINFKPDSFHVRTDFQQCLQDEFCLRSNLGQHCDVGRQERYLFQ